VLSLQRCSRDDLEAAGFDVFTTAVDYVASLDLDCPGKRVRG
jgi:hypothetical protein